MREDDAAECRRILEAGSKSFWAAGLLLPARVRDPVAACYAFCRVADDAIDGAPGRELEALAGLSGRLDAIYAGRPEDRGVDRAFCDVARVVPRAVPEALLEGFLWDAEGRRYEDLGDLLGYAARVASSVGVMMTALLGRADPVTLARACDLGLAMQLTNIARDVGEDASMGRVYLPLSWLREEGVEEQVAKGVFTPGVGRVVERLLAEADRLYARADLGIPRLPPDGRRAIRAARLLYSDIGRVIRQAGCDSVSRRAHTGGLRKAWLLGRALIGGERGAGLHAGGEAGGGVPGGGPAPEVKFLIDAFAGDGGGLGR